MNKKILVTGGEGFIGKHLVKRLRADKYQEVSIDKKTGININGKKLEGIFKKHKLDCVIHLASEVGVRDSLKRPEDYMQTNVIGTYKLLRLVKQYEVNQFIFTSSSSVYGKRGGKKGFEETDKLSPISPYGITKMVAEKACEITLKNSGTHLTLLRFFTVYGPDNRRDMAVFQFTDDIAHNKVIQLYGHGTRRDFTYVDDIVDAIVRSVKKPFKFEVINLGNSRPITVLKLIRTIEKYLGKKAKIVRKPLPKGDVPITFANILKAERLLGWKPKVKVEVGIKRFIDWYKGEYRL